MYSSWKVDGTSPYILVYKDPLLTYLLVSASHLFWFYFDLKVTTAKMCFHPKHKGFSGCFQIAEHRLDLDEKQIIPTRLSKVSLIQEIALANALWIKYLGFACSVVGKCKKTPNGIYHGRICKKSPKKKKQKIPEFSGFSYRNLKEKEGVKCPLLTLKLGGLDPPSPTKEVILLWSIKARPFDHLDSQQCYEVISTHLWNTPLNLYQQAIMGFL